MGVDGRTNINLEQGQESPAYKNETIVRMKDGHGFFSWIVTVKSSYYNYARGGWDYIVEHGYGNEIPNVSETMLKSEG